MMVAQQEKYVPNSHDLEGLWIPRNIMGFLGCLCTPALGCMYTGHIACGKGLLCSPGMAFGAFGLCLMCNHVPTGSNRCLTESCVGIQLTKGADEEKTGAKYDGNVQVGDEAVLVGCCICEPCCNGCAPCCFEVKRMMVFRPNPTYKGAGAAAA